MKKYFLNKSFLAVAAFLLCCLASCSDYQPFDEHDLTVSQYEKDFVQSFGKPAANHQWGFIDQPVYGSEGTRAVDVNSNLWYNTYGGHLTIPGMPDHLHGYFRGTNTFNDQGVYTKYITKAQADEAMAKDQNWVGNNVGNPRGDVTDEEREFVWNWFATHPNPTTTDVHWDSFFIQYVTSYTERYKNSGVNNTRVMNLLEYERIDGTREHINNFNNETRAMQYVYKAGTEKWAYQVPHSSTTVNNRFTLQHLVFDIESPDCPFHCTVHHYDGWYLGFDYHSVKGDAGDVEADGIYNDWVVKINPGNLVGYPKTVRVMCEDLGQENSDWDFNDVVFDVSFVQRDGKTYVGITLQAAGGTMPITVATQDSRYEVHKLLGDGSMKPIIHPQKYAYYEVEYNKPLSSNNTANANAIPIYVNNSTEAVVYTITNSHVAQKFACPDDVSWTEENENIFSRYTKLREWVQNERCVDIWHVENGGSPQIDPTIVPVPIPDNGGENTGDQGNSDQGQDNNNQQQGETNETIDMSSLGTAVNLQSGISDPATVKISEVLNVKNQGDIEITFVTTSDNVASETLLSKDGSSIAWGNDQNIANKGLTKKSAGNGVYLVTVVVDAATLDAIKDYYLAIRIYNGGKATAIYVK